ncbi:hypothetical protein [Myxococcus sp. CA056]|uniref:hypothetical protein n=1 Tax=Myxococcus sp. CA056 TaxID=2741740 RepID=UPI00157BB567|nr:hypothetical protein [Myxococcus sp. CA056]
MGGGLSWRGKVGVGGLFAALAAFAPGSAEADAGDLALGHHHKEKHEKKKKEDAAGTGGSGAAAMMGPRVGGHVAAVIPFLSVTDEDTTVIFGDFFDLGLAPGITLHLNERWALDFEFIAYSRWRFEDGGRPASVSTSIVLDPGVIYDFGQFKGGLRLAMQVGAGVPFNMGVVPIIIKGFPITEHLKWFVELDLPFFVTGAPGDGGFSFSPQIQTGIAF